MSKYIDQQAAVAVIEEKQKELCPVGRYGRDYVYGSDREKYDNWDEIIDALENLPAADAVPVVHGEWIRCNASLLTHCQCGAYPVNLAWYRCSVCGRTAPKKEPYCHCGAKMDGGAHETD